jgi:hypothetical protein
MKKLKLAALAAMMTLLASCGMNKAYLVADRLTYEAIAPDYSAYVMEDESLSAKDREIYLRTLTIWLQRIDEADKIAGIVR